MIAEHGVAGTTHRLIATAADVPLGSLTYYFTSLAELRAQAFELHARRMSAQYAAYFDAVRTRDDLTEAITDLVHGLFGTDPSDMVVAYELYIAALRDPRLRKVTESWMRESQDMLERFVDPVTARGVDALVEGLILHNTLTIAPMSRDQVRSVVARALAPDHGGPAAAGSP